MKAKYTACNMKELNMTEEYSKLELNNLQACNRTGLCS